MDDVPTSFCASCGKKRESKQKFCQFCGSKFPLTEHEERLIKKWGTDASPILKENFIGMFRNPSKTMERIYDTKSSWEPGFIIVVFFGLFMGISLFIVLLKTNFTIIGTDTNLVNYFTENILYLKIYLAIFEVVAFIIQWFLYILIFFGLLYLFKNKIRFEKLVVLGETAAISLLFIGIFHIIIALLIPTIQSTINVDTFAMDLDQKFIAIINSNILFLIFFYSDYPITIIFYIILGYGISFKEGLEKYQILIIIVVTFLLGQIVFPFIITIL